MVSWLAGGCLGAGRQSIGNLHACSINLWPTITPRCMTHKWVLMWPHDADEDPAKEEPAKEEEPTPEGERCFCSAGG